MIFVTVGTTMPFDELLEAVDKLAGDDFFGQPVICQTGNSSYTPNNCEHFKFKPDLQRHIDKSDFLIIHGGTGSTIEALMARKPFIAMANPRAAGGHQHQFLTRMHQEYGITWGSSCQELSKLYALEKSRTSQTWERSRVLADAILKLCEKSAKPS